MHIERLIDDYDIWHQVSGHSAKTREWYRWILRTFTRWLTTTGRSPLVADITIGDARAFLQAEATRTVLCPAHPTGVERPGRLSDRTLQGYARALRGFFAWLEAEEYLAVSPMRKLKLPRVEERLKDVLAVPDIERLLAVCNTKTFLGSRMYAMVALMYDSGLRAGEVVDLDHGDIDWGEYRVKIRRGKGKKDRFEPFSVATHRAIRHYLILREPFALDGQTALFISAAGDTITRGALTQAVKRLGPALPPAVWSGCPCLSAAGWKKVARGRNVCAPERDLDLPVSGR